MSARRDLLPALSTALVLAGVSPAFAESTRAEEEPPSERLGELEAERGGAQVVEREVSSVEAGAVRRTQRLAVPDFQLSGVDERLSRVVLEALMAELRKLTGVSVIGMDEVRQMLDFEAERQSLGCDDDTSCLSEIADALGVDVLVTGSLARIEREHVFALKRIDQREAQVAGAYLQRLVAEDGEEVLAAIGPAVAELFPEVPLRPGAVRGVAPEVALRLNPPPLSPWMFWTTAGSATALLTAAGGFFVMNMWSHGTYQETLSAGQSRPITNDVLSAQEAQTNTFAALAWGALGTSAVVAALASGMAFFVDWRGYRDAQ